MSRTNRQYPERKASKKLQNSNAANKDNHGDSVELGRFAEAVSSDSWPADPGPPETQREARKSYLRAVVEKKPEVLQSLLENVLPSFVQIYEVGHKSLSGNVLTTFDATLSSWHLLTTAGYPGNDPAWLRRQHKRIGAVRLVPSSFPSKQVARPILDGLHTLVYALQDWSSGWWWLYQSDWWYDHALQTLAQWHREDLGGELDWLYELDDVTPNIQNFSPFVFGYHPFRPDREPWREYKRRLSAEFKDTASKYRGRIEAQWTSAPGERLRLARKKDDAHFKMLVEFHFIKEKPKALSKKYRLELSTISEALRGACHQLPIRYERLVQPQKTK